MLYDYTRVTAETVTAETDAAVARAEQLVAGAAASAGQPSFDATLRPLELAGVALLQAYGRGAFLAQVHPDEGVRDVAQEADERINKWRVSLPFREDLYRALPLVGRENRQREYYLPDVLDVLRGKGETISAVPADLGGGQRHDPRVWALDGGRHRTQW